MLSLSAAPSKWRRLVRDLDQGMESTWLLHALQQYLVEHGPGILYHAEEHMDRNLAHLAAKAGDRCLDLFKFLLDHAPRMCFKSRDKYGQTPLMFALESGGLRIACLLLQRQAEINGGWLNESLVLQKQTQDIEYDFFAFPMMYAEAPGGFRYDFQTPVLEVRAEEMQNAGVRAVDAAEAVAAGFASPRYAATIAKVKEEEMERQKQRLALKIAGESDWKNGVDERPPEPPPPRMYKPIEDNPDLQIYTPNPRPLTPAGRPRPELAKRVKNLHLAWEPQNIVDTTRVSVTTTTPRGRVVTRNDPFYWNATLKLGMFADESEVFKDFSQVVVEEAVVRVKKPKKKKKKRPNQWSMGSMGEFAGKNVKPVGMPDSERARSFAANRRGASIGASSGGSGSRSPSPPGGGPPPMMGGGSSGVLAKAGGSGGLSVSGEQSTSPRQGSKNNSSTSTSGKNTNSTSSSFNAAVKLPGLIDPPITQDVDEQGRDAIWYAVKNKRYRVTKFLMKEPRVTSNMELFRLACKIGCRIGTRLLIDAIERQNNSQQAMKLTASPGRSGGAPAAILGPQDQTQAGELSTSQSSMSQQQQLIPIECLHDCAKSQDVKACKLLLDRKCFVDSRYGTLNDTPLMVACRRSDKRMVELLLQYGADVTLKNNLNCSVDKIAFEQFAEANRFENRLTNNEQLLVTCKEICIAIRKRAAELEGKIYIIVDDRSLDYMGGNEKRLKAADHNLPQDIASSRKNSRSPSPVTNIAKGGTGIPGSPSQHSATAYELASQPDSESTYTAMVGSGKKKSKNKNK
ncbi:unnamed protein product [Amoebophrya sp. A25]|nr:unnamed protein product [Amoebophrya sp. A25]|eukprot:GSA25T00000163001.1